MAAKLTVKFSFTKKRPSSVKDDPPKKLWSKIDINFYQDSWQSLPELPAMLLLLCAS
jgi:hypothetical protein